MPNCSTVLNHNYMKVNKPLSVYFVQSMQSLHTMIQIKALRKMKMFCFKTRVLLRYPLALNRNKQHLKKLQILQHCQQLDPHFLLSDGMSIVISYSSRVCPTILNILHAKVVSPIKFLLNSNRVSCDLFFCFPHQLLIKSRHHLIFSLHLELDDVVR